MKQTYTGISIVFASLLLATSSLVSTAEASLTEQAKDESQTPSIQAQVHIPIEEHVLEEGAPVQSGGWFGGWFTGWFGSSSNPKAVESATLTTPEAEVDPATTQTPSSQPPSVTPTPSTSSVDDANTTETAETIRLKQLEAQIALYAQKHGRTEADLMQSIMIAQPLAELPESVDTLTEQLGAMKISVQKADKTLYINAPGEDQLSIIKDAAGLSVPLYSKIHYYVQHRESKTQKTEWLTGVAIFEKLISTPSKKYTVLKIAETASHEPIWEATK
ncbi:MAG: hypothetical protein ACTHJ4_00925 [Candidatus Nucleicultricaceae bacterium]